MKNVLIQFISSDKIIIKKNFYYNKNTYFFIILQLIKQLLQFFAAKISKIIYKKNIPNNIILIDTYVLPNFYCEDRYFTSMYQFIDKNLLDKIFFVPTITYTSLRLGINPIGNIYNVYKELRNCKRNFLIKEDFLNLNDIFLSIFYCIRIKKLKLNNLKFDNIDFSEIFNFDLILNSQSNLSIEAWNNYNFIKNISKKIKIKKFINWWENQQVDKGYNLAFSKYLPNTTVNGYLGYSPRNLELHVSPITIDSISNTIPKNISVIGKDIIPLVKKFSNKINVSISPAFRYNYLSKIKIRRIKTINNILVTLPINIDDSIFIIKKINNIFELNQLDYTFYIKPHPTTSLDILNKYIKRKEIILTDNKLIDLFQLNDLTITSMSITALESLHIDIPVIVCETFSIIDFNPIPKNISKNIWEYNLFDQDILESIIKIEKKIKSYKKISNKNEYFLFPNNENVKQFFK